MSLKALPVSRFTLALCFSVATAAINPIGPTITREYSSCLLSLAEDNFKPGGLIVVADTYNATSPSVTGVRSTLLRVLHSTASQALLVISPESGESDYDPLGGESLDDLHFRPVEAYVAAPLGEAYVIVVDGFTQFRRIVMKLSTLRTWNPRAIFLVLCLKMHRPGDRSAHYAEIMLTYLFLLNVVNAVVMLPEPSDRRRVRIYGWRPYDPPKYCGYRNETAVERLVLQNVCDRGIVEHHNYMFAGKVPRYMTGCVLEAIALAKRPFVNLVGDDEPGIERSLMDEIANAIRYEFRYSDVQTQRGERDSSGEWTGALARLKAGEGVLVFGAVFPDNDVHEDFEASVSYFSDSYAWVVPRAAPAPPWLALVVIFERRVWLAALAIYALCVGTWRQLGRGGGETRYHRSLAHCALNAWYTLLGGCAYARPVGHGLRTFFVFYTLYCVLFLTAYQTKLIDVLTNPSFEEQLATPAQLARSGLRWGGIEELNDLFEDSSDELDQELGASYVNIIDETAALGDVVTHRNFSLLSSRLAALDASARSDALSDADGLPNFYTFDGNAFSIPAEFVTLAGFPFMERMNGLVSVFDQIGVTSLILERYRARTSRRRARAGSTEAAEARALSLRHLQGGFLVLAAGQAGGGLALALELLVSSARYRRALQTFIDWTKIIKNMFIM